MRKIVTKNRLAEGREKADAVEAFRKDLTAVWNEMTDMLRMLARDDDKRVMAVPFPSDEFYDMLERVLPCNPSKADAGDGFDGADKENYDRILKNIKFFCVTFAHLAKRCTSFSAAREYLMAASVLDRVINQPGKSLTEAQCMRLVAHLRNGDEELAVALDYAEMPDWESYRQKTLAPIFAGERAS